MEQKPDINLVDWNSPSGNTIEPTNSKKASGYVPREPLPAQNFNWILKSISKWTSWLVNVVTELIQGTPRWQNDVKYNFKDIVNFQGRLYFSTIVDNEGNEPTSNLDKWMLCEGEYKEFFQTNFLMNGPPTFLNEKNALLHNDVSGLALSEGESLPRTVATIFHAKATHISQSLKNFVTGTGTGFPASSGPIASNVLTGSLVVRNTAANTTGGIFSSSNPSTWTSRNLPAGASSWGNAPVYQYLNLGGFFGIDNHFLLSGVNTSGGNSQFRLCRSADNGATWAVVTTPWSGISMNEGLYWYALSTVSTLSFPLVEGPQYICCPAFPGQILRSENGGTTWTTLALPEGDFTATKMIRVSSSSAIILSSWEVQADYFLKMEVVWNSDLGIDQEFFTKIFYADVFGDFEDVPKYTPSGFIFDVPGRKKHGCISSIPDLGLASSLTTVLSVSKRYSPIDPGDPETPGDIESRHIFLTQDGGETFTDITKKVLPPMYAAILGFTEWLPEDIKSEVTEYYTGIYGAPLILWEQDTEMPSPCLVVHVGNITLGNGFGAPRIDFYATSTNGVDWVMSSSVGDFLGRGFFGGVGFMSPPDFVDFFGSYSRPNTSAAGWVTHPRIY